MRDSWLELLDCVLRPARPRLEECLREQERHRAGRRVVAEERARVLANCAAEIESARAAVLAANDGLIPSRMTDLEREWRRLARPDPEDGLMDLWARIAPASWVDRKRWNDCEPGAKLDAAIALASDVDGVEAAESATGRLRLALAAWGVTTGSRIRWRYFEGDAEWEGVKGLLAEPLRRAREAVAARGAERVVVARAEQVERAVEDGTRERFPQRPLLARALAHAAFVDCFLRGAALAECPNPVTALRELWKTGYALAAMNAGGATLEIPLPGTASRPALAER